MDNRYIFILIVTVVCSFILSTGDTILRDNYDENVRVDSKKNILICSGIDKDSLNLLSNKEIDNKYNKKIKKLLINGELPIYISESNNGLEENYIIPISGQGLWSTLYGYIAIDMNDFKVKAITFYKHKETPGLGGEVDAEWFQKQFIGKEIFNKKNELISITITKSGAPTSIPKNHVVDGISGATVTSKGVEKFLKSDLLKYESFFKKNMNN